MCHHWDSEYRALYEGETEREELPEWANEPEDDAEATEEEPATPSVADD